MFLGKELFPRENTNLLLFIFLILFIQTFLINAGRGRAENSHFYVLASAEKCVAERERNNTFKETMMEEAMKKVQQQIDDNHDAFLVKQRELQKVAKRERDAAKRNKSGRVVQHGQFSLR